MISLADLFGFPPPIDASQSNAPMNMPIGPPWPDPLTSSPLPLTSGFTGTALKPDSIGAGEPPTWVNPANWPPQASTFESLSSPMPSPPPIPSGGVLGGPPSVGANGASSPMGGGILSQYTDWRPRSSLQPVAFNLSAAAPSGGASSAHPASSFTTNLPVPSPQTSWAAPQLPLFPAESRDNRLNATQIGDDPAVLSDADPDAWLPNAQYANRGARRGGRRASEAELSPVEEIRWTIYNHNWEILRQLDPRNRLLTSFQDERWVPSQSQIQRLKEEIARIQRGLGSSGFEQQHNLPREFEKEFKACGIDIEDYVIYLERNLHRLRPDGLHTGADSWNKIWRRYFANQQALASKDEQADEILNQLIRMWENAQWLRR